MTPDPTRVPCRLTPSPLPHYTFSHPATLPLHWARPHPASRPSLCVLTPQPPAPTKVPGDPTLRHSQAPSWNYLLQGDPGQTTKESGRPGTSPSGDGVLESPSPHHPTLTRADGHPVSGPDILHKHQTPYRGPQGRGFGWACSQTKSPSHP